MTNSPQNKEPIFIYDPKKREWKTVYIPITPQRLKELAEVNKKLENYQQKKQFPYKKTEK